MITKYLTSIQTTFNPLSRSRAHRIPRIILAFLKPDARAASGGGMSISNKLLPASSAAPSSLVVTFRDGKELRFVQRSDKKDEWDLDALRVKDVVDEVDRHSRMLGRKAELNG